MIRLLLPSVLLVTACAQGPIHEAIKGSDNPASSEPRYTHKPPRFIMLSTIVEQPGLNDLSTKAGWVQDEESGHCFLHTLHNRSSIAYYENESFSRIDCDAIEKIASRPEPQAAEPSAVLPGH